MRPLFRVFFCMAYKVKKLYSCQIALVFYYSIVHLSDHVHDDFHHFFEWCVVLETKTEPVVFEVLDTIYKGCLLYTSDAADEEDSVDLGGRRSIKKKKRKKATKTHTPQQNQELITMMTKYIEDT